jgi:hypothetical protein
MIELLTFLLSCFVFVCVCNRNRNDNQTVAEVKKNHFVHDMPKMVEEYVMII